MTRSSSRRLLSLAAVLAALTMAVASSPALAAREIALSSLVPSTSRAGADKPEVYYNGCHAAYDVVTAPSCWFGAARGPVVILVGDSHAASLVPALDVAGRARGWRVLSLTKSGCPIVPLRVRVYNKPQVHPYCTAWRAAARQIIARTAATNNVAAIITVGASIHQVADDANRLVGGRTLTRLWRTATADFVSFAHRHSRRVIVLRDNPNFVQDAPSCLRANPTAFSACGARRAAALAPLVWTGVRAGVPLGRATQAVDLSDFYCSPMRCDVTDGRWLIYRDTGHLTATYSRVIGPRLGATLAQLLR